MAARQLEPRSVKEFDCLLKQGLVVRYCSIIPSTAVGVAVMPLSPCLLEHSVTPALISYAGMTPGMIYVIILRVHAVDSVGLCHPCCRCSLVRLRVLLRIHCSLRGRRHKMT